MTYIALSDYVGAAEPLQPATMAFTVKPGTSCRACAFRGQRAAVCSEAVRLAELAGMESCDRSGLVYVLKRTDERQLTLKEAV